MSQSRTTFVDPTVALLLHALAPAGAADIVVSRAAVPPRAPTTKTRLKSIGPVVAALALGALVPAARADITVNSSFAGIEARAAFDVDEDGILQNDEKDIPGAISGSPGTFNQTSTAAVGGAKGRAAQDATVEVADGTLTIVASGDCSGQASLSGDHDKDLQRLGSGVGSILVEFTVTKPATFSVSADVSVAPPPAPGGGDNRALVGFAPNGVSAVDIEADDASTDLMHDAASVSGTLPPGTYDVLAQCQSIDPRNAGGVIGPPGGQARFRFLLIVAESECTGPVSRWVGGAAGAFDNPQNWDPPQVPSFGASGGECEEALFDKGKIVDLSAADVPDVPAAAMSGAGVTSAGRARAAGSHTAGRLHVRRLKTLQVRSPLGLTLADGSLDKASVVVDGKSTLAVIDGGVLEAQYAHIGESGKGFVFVSGAGSAFDIADLLTIGASSDGSVQFVDGSTGAGAAVRIGDGARGDARVARSASWHTGDLAVGFGSPGTLTVEDGGEVVSDRARVGVDLPAAPVPAFGKAPHACLGRKGGAAAEVVGASADATSSAWRVDTLAIGGLGCVEVANEGGIVTAAGSPPTGDLLVGTTEAGEGALLVHDGGVAVVAGNLVVGEGGPGRVVLTEDFFHDPRINVAGALLVGCSLPPAGNGHVLVEGDIATDPASLTSSTLRVPDGNTAQGELKITEGGRVTTTTTAEIGTDGTADPVGFHGGNGVVELDGRTTVAIPIAGHDQLTRWQIGESLTIGPASGPGDGQLLISEATVAVGLPPAQGAVTIHSGGAVAGFGSANNLITNGGVVLNDGVIQGPIFLGASLDPASHGRIIAPFSAPPSTAAPPAVTTGARAAKAPPPAEGPVVISGDADVSNTTLVLQFRNGFAPRQGDLLPAVEVEGQMTGTFANVEVEGLAPGALFDVATMPGMAIALTDTVALPVVGIKAPRKLKESAKRAKVKLIRSGPTTAPLTVHYRVGGSAENGIDYVTLPGTLEIPVKKKSATLVVQPFVDGVPEPVETIDIEVLPGDDYAPSVPSKATIPLFSTDRKPR
jgi:T5SS/PEP-CTERM-associated repeat protein